VELKREVAAKSNHIALTAEIKLRPLFSSNLVVGLTSPGKNMAMFLEFYFKKAVNFEVRSQPRHAGDVN